MATVYLVLLGRKSFAPESEKSGAPPIWPSAEDYLEIQQLLQDQEFNLVVLAVASGLTSAEVNYTGAKVLSSAPADFRYTIKNPETYVDEDIRDSSVSAVIYLDQTDSTSSYQTMEKIESFNTYNRWFLRGSSRQPSSINYPEIVRSYIRNSHPSIYDLYSGKELPVALPAPEREYLELRIPQACRLIRSFLDTRFHTGKMPASLVHVEPYQLDLSYPILAGLITYHGLQPISPGRDFNLEFSTNAQYRQIVTEALVRIFSNYLIANRILTSEEVRALIREKQLEEGWFNPNVWSLALSRKLVP